MIEYVALALLLTGGIGYAAWKYIKRRHGTHVVEYISDENGVLVDLEELKYRRKYIDFRKSTWDAINVVEFPGIQSYRQCVPSGVPRRGIIHYVHGYGDPLPHYSYLA